MSATNNPQLSILIPSIPSRWGSAIALYNSLLTMVGDKKIEILLLTDNKHRTIGAKREALKNLAQGKYFCFCDDDDQLLSLDEIYEATFRDVHVINFNAECLNGDGSTYIVTQQLGNNIEHNTENGRYLDCKRPPFHNCAWHKLFKKFKFPDVNYAEDWGFIQKCLKYATSENHIDKVLFRYNFNPTITEASTADNAIWNNPNHERISKRCVVNVSTERYWQGQTRLIKSLTDYSPDIDVLTFGSELEVGAAPHSENNYSFKPMAILKAYELGYRQILWLDASMNVIRDIAQVFDIIDKDGYFFVDSGWPNSRWTNEFANEYFGTNDGEMLSSGILGVDLTNSTAYAFFDAWTQSMRDGIFNGDWETHRHDQTAASLIAYKMGMKLQEANTFMVYGKEGNQFITDKTLILADGICL